MSDKLERTEIRQSEIVHKLVDENVLIRLIMNISLHIFTVLFIFSVSGNKNFCQYHWTHGMRRHLFGDPSNCAKYYKCSYYNEYGYRRIRTEHLRCPQGKFFVRTLPNGQAIEAGGACIGDHPSTVSGCFLLRGTFKHFEKYSSVHY